MLIATRILVATDFSEAADVAWRYGRELARALMAKLHVVHVATDITATGVLPLTYVPAFGNAQREILETSRARLAEVVGTDAGRESVTSEVVVSSAPALGILDYAQTHEINLIVVGTHGHTAMTQLLLGSVAEKIVRSAKCPVLTVRHPEKEFAIPDNLQRAS